ncbi:1-acyl-sn-glycerol-3-phosphate acyltransferase [Methylobacterium organophilum]|uniref:lysophospholipid acyltransferase family protein n=1 Tax=Methylobacterium organophilum TaxID=410 RepID=UPI001F137821|nr:lysophospholipid acyltransferase family protein [Methylobacterium organophilum]UMY18217.1 1-acyl-sn-glycerol-3-phosphate acyltransferase [Methylobacterium organophilum]
MLVLRSLAFNLCFYVATTALALLALPALAARKGVIRVAQFWGGTVVFLLRVVAGTRVEFRGLENIPKGPLLVAAKHQSALETLALTTPFEDFAYVLKRELMWIPVIGWYLGRGGMVPIDRSKGAKTMAALNAAASAAIAEGRQLIIFPEGTRRPAGAPPAYKQGASHLYTTLNVPCLPVALNTGLYWRRRGFRRMPGTTVIEFLPPIPPGLPRAAFLKELEHRIETASEALFNEGRADLARRGHPVAVAMAGSVPETSGTL